MITAAEMVGTYCTLSREDRTGITARVVNPQGDTFRFYVRSSGPTETMLGVALDVAWAARKLRRMRRRGNPVYPHSGGAA